MLNTTNSDYNIQNNSSTALMNENNFNYLDQYKPQENYKFGRGHIIRQYMSGVGVITERYIPDDHLFFESGNSLTSISDVKSLENLFEEEENEEEECNTTVVVNCPCYEKAWDEELKKSRSFINIFLSCCKQETTK